MLIIAFQLSASSAARSTAFEQHILSNDSTVVDEDELDTKEIKRRARDIEKYVEVLFVVLVSWCARALLFEQHVLSNNNSLLDEDEL